MSDNQNSNHSSSMPAGQRWLLFAFAGPIYLASMAGLGRGLFALALPSLPYDAGQWIGIAIGILTAAIVIIVAAVTDAIRQWLLLGEWNGRDKNNRR